jgi:hypothetical protein
VRRAGLIGLVFTVGMCAWLLSARVSAASMSRKDLVMERIETLRAQVATIHMDLRPDVWMPRGMCGPWETWLAVLYIVSNAAIAVSYFIIPVSVVIAYARGIKNPNGPPDQRQMWGWCAFIVLCGIGHATENVLGFWHAQYAVFTGIHLATAIASVYTASTLPAFVVRRAL